MQSTMNPSGNKGAAEPYPPQSRPMPSNSAATSSAAASYNPREYQLPRDEREDGNGGEGGGTSKATKGKASTRFQNRYDHIHPSTIPSHHGAPWCSEVRCRYKSLNFQENWTGTFDASKHTAA